jgi:hypothetical protein
MTKHPIYVALALVVLLVTGCSSDQLDVVKSRTVTQPLSIGLGNLTVIEIDPNGRQVNLDWKSFNLSSKGGAFEFLTLESGAERYVITDRNDLNNALTINDQIYKFDSLTKHVRIRFGKGITVAGGADYNSTEKDYTSSDPLWNCSAPPDTPHSR